MGICFSGFSDAAKVDTTGFYEISVVEKKLAKIAPIFINGENDQMRQNAAWLMYRSLDTLLNIPSSYYYPFDSLKTKTVSIQDVKPGKFRVFTFNLILSNGDFKNFGYIQLRDGRENQVFELLDTSKKHKKDYLDVELETNEWYGALYYSIVPTKIKRKKAYILLGYDGSDVNSNKKVIDVLWFDRGTPVFGKAIFKDGKFDLKPACRVVFEFHNESGMMLRYEPERKILVLDNLAPAFPEAVNDYPYYIPSGDLDYYMAFKDGFWVKDALDNYDFGQGKKVEKKKELPTPKEEPEETPPPVKEGDEN